MVGLCWLWYVLLQQCPVEIPLTWLTWHASSFADVVRSMVQRRQRTVVGGDSGAGICEASLSAERQILEMLDSLLPVDWRQGVPGHADLYSLRLLSDVEIIVDGMPVDMRPLILLDDGHELPRTQRDALLKRLVPRELAVSRWYSERFEALSPEEVLAVCWNRRARLRVAGARTEGG